MRLNDLNLRIWNIGDECFYYPNWKNTEDGLELEMIDSSGNKLRKFDINEIELEFSLSVKDIHGKYLYENDIVGFNGEAYRIIRKADEFFIANNLKLKFIPTGDILELLGNIHKNPELIDIHSLDI